MKKVKRALAIAAALALALSLAGCGTLMTDSVKTLVQGNMDELYLGKYDEAYLELVDSTAEESEQNYLGGLEYEAEYFAQYFNVENLTDEIKAEIVELYKEIYSHSKYEVGEASKVDETTYGVKVTIYPLDLMQKVLEESDAAIEELNAQFTEEQLATEEGYAEYDAAWARMFIGLCREKLANVGYLEPEEIVVQVVQDPADGLWTISENDFQRVDSYIIAY